MLNPGLDLARNEGEESVVSSSTCRSVEREKSVLTLSSLLLSGDLDVSDPPSDLLGS